MDTIQATTTSEPTAAAARSPAPAAAGRTTAARLGRIARQLALAAVSAVAYYALTRWLLDRFGQRGFLYALFALAAVVALWREFSPDIRALPQRLRTARTARRAARTRRRAADVRRRGGVADDSDDPVVPETTSRLEAEDVYRTQQARLADGELTPAAFKEFAAGFYYLDTSGKFWTIQDGDAGSWAYFRGGEWHRGLPLGTLTRHQDGQGGPQPA